MTNVHAGALWKWGKPWPRLWLIPKWAGLMAPRRLLAGFHGATGYVAVASTPGQHGAARESARQCEWVEQVLKSQTVLLCASSRQLSPTGSKYRRVFAEDSASLAGRRMGSARSCQVLSRSQRGQVSSAKGGGAFGYSRLGCNQSIRKWP